MKDKGARNMDAANLTNVIDTNYKNGFVECACKWHKELGDGFNQYFIDHCPNCTPELHTRTQTKVTTGRPGGYTISYGAYRYFIIKGCIHVQYDGFTTRTEMRKQLPR